MISIIAAIGKNRELGVKNRIPWHIREDLLRFKHLTTGKIVIVGRKTFESLVIYYQKSQRPFPKRTYIIVTRDNEYKPKLTNVVETQSSQFISAGSVREAIEKGKKIDSGEIFLIGGASIYQEGIKYADKLYLTLVDIEVADADAFFPDYSDFKNASIQEVKSSDGLQFRFVELIR